jgi:hypothetical protein
VPLEECKQWWRDNEGIDHKDFSLPASWHLNRANVLVSLVPQPMSQLMVEIRCRIQNLPKPLHCERKY